MVASCAKFRVGGCYDAAKVSRDTGLDNFGESKTVQSSKDEADINTIVRRFGVTGQMPVGVRLPSFADYDEVFDFQSAQNILIEATRSFEMFPVEIRQRFGNDPQLFLEFCGDPANSEEAIKLGLGTKPAEPVAVPPVSGTPGA